MLIIYVSIIYYKSYPIFQLFYVDRVASKVMVERRSPCFLTWTTKKLSARQCYEKRHNAFGRGKICPPSYNQPEDRCHEDSVPNAGGTTYEEVHDDTKSLKYIIQ